MKTDHLLQAITALEAARNVLVKDAPIHEQMRVAFMCSDAWVVLRREITLALPEVKLEEAA